MAIIISNTATEPIYEQIARQIKDMILRGEMAEGSLLPSIRSLARELQVSVITTKRAYDELEKEGFLETVGGKGTFVAGQSRELLRERKLAMVEEKLAEAVTECRRLGISPAEAAHILQLLFREEE
ncbi:MAG: GntR family transcriptional regulator [bacterium]|jgi:GntR family transcriptional regulator